MMKALIRSRFLLPWLLLTVPTLGHGQNSGLLLGLHTDPFSGPAPNTGTYSAYRTLWIVGAGGKVGVAAEWPTVVVPRNSGFWRLDIEVSCGITDATMEMEGPFLDRLEEAVWQPLTSPRTFQPAGDAMDCGEARARLRRIDTLNVEGAEAACNIRDVAITYASPNYVSYATQYQQTEFCSPGRYTSSTALSVLDTLEQTPSLLEALGPERAAAVQAGWEAGRSDCGTEASPEENWGIVRGLGQWVTDLASSGSTACRGEGMGVFDVQERMPASIAHSEPASWLPRLKAVVDPVDDFFVSPAEDLVAVRSGDRLLFFVPTGRDLGRPVPGPALRPGEQVVLVEWAVGRHVARWTRELSRPPR